MPSLALTHHTLDHDAFISDDALWPSALFDRVIQTSGGSASGHQALGEQAPGVVRTVRPSRSKMQRKVWAVRDQPVHSPVDQPDHVFAPVHGPGQHMQAECMGLLDVGLAQSRIVDVKAFI